MKNFTFFFLLVLTSSVIAAERSFQCDDGLENIVSLKLTDHSAEFGEIKLVNHMEVNHNFRLRSYVFINNPWYNLDVEIQMLKGEEGFATLSSHEMPVPNYKTQTYNCTPANE